MSQIDSGSRRDEQTSSAGTIRRRRRYGLHLDMTPLVDVAFLLLTFFMFATTMAQPQVMEMSVPRDLYSRVPVPSSQLRTIYVRGDGAIFYDTGEDPTLHRTGLEELRSILDRQGGWVSGQLIVTLKVDRLVQHQRFIGVLDELHRIEASPAVDAPDTFGDRSWSLVLLGTSSLDRSRMEAMR